MDFGVFAVWRSIVGRQVCLVCVGNNGYEKKAKAEGKKEYGDKFFHMYEKANLIAQLEYKLYKSINQYEKFLIPQPSLKN
ncbi:MAG: hypothetical protein HQL12_09090 [Candidatus Omnitrophica bacterium]|nr:hypothetical protein [Candidatus Omnitrophota bacterium]